MSNMNPLYELRFAQIRRERLEGRPHVDRRSALQIAMRARELGSRWRRSA